MEQFIRVNLVGQGFRYFVADCDSIVRECSRDNMSTNERDYREFVKTYDIMCTQKPTLPLTISINRTSDNRLVLGMAARLNVSDEYGREAIYAHVISAESASYFGDYIIELLDQYLGGHDSELTKAYHRAMTGASDGMTAARTISRIYSKNISDSVETKKASLGSTNILAGITNVWCPWPTLNIVNWYIIARAIRDGSIVDRAYDVHKSGHVTTMLSERSGRSISTIGFLDGARIAWTAAGSNAGGDCVELLSRPAPSPSRSRRVVVHFGDDEKALLRNLIEGKKETFETIASHRERSCRSSENRTLSDGWRSPGDRYRERRPRRWGLLWGASIASIFWIVVYIVVRYIVRW